MDKTRADVQEQVREYEPPKVVDYGTLVDLTAGGHAANSDTYGGPNNTAYSVGV